MRIAGGILNDSECAEQKGNEHGDIFLEKDEYCCLLLQRGGERGGEGGKEAESLGNKKTGAAEDT